MSENLNKIKPGGTIFISGLHIEYKNNASMVKYSQLIYKDKPND